MLTMTIAGAGLFRRPPGPLLPALASAPGKRMGSFLGTVVGRPDDLKYDVKYDPWSKTLMEKGAFFEKWGKSYQQHDLEDCWLKLRNQKAWEELRGDKLPYPNFLNWPVRQHMKRLLDDLPRPETYAIVSLIYGDKVEALAQGLALGCSLAGKTKYPCILLHTPDVPGKHLKALKNFWKLICVSPIAGSSRLTSEAPEFKNVFTKLHVFNKEQLPFDRVLFLDLDTLVVSCLDEVLETGYTLAAVGCPTRYVSEGIKKKKRLFISTPEGEWMKPGDTFNGGVMLVSPHQDIFKLLSTDCQRLSNWHYPTTYPESHYLKWVADWRSLSPSLNLCPRMGKGQANTPEWQEMPWKQVEIFHFSTRSKPYYWFEQGTIWAMHSSADDFPEELAKNVEMRAQRAYDLWISYLALALMFMATHRKKTFVMCFLIRDWKAYVGACELLLENNTTTNSTPTPQSYTDVAKEIELLQLKY